MGRAARRAAGAKGREPVYNLTQPQIDGIRKEAADAAVARAFSLMLALPMMVVHDKFDRFDGLGDSERVEAMGDLVLDLYDSFERGYVTLADLHEWLRDEAGVTVSAGGGTIRVERSGK